MKMFNLIAVALMLVGGDVWAQVPKGALYECFTKDVQELEESGNLERTAVTEMNLRNYTKFIFDEASGLLRFGFGITREFKMIQKGSRKNSAIGLHIYNGAGSNTIIRNK